VAGISGRPACGSAFRKVSCGPPPGLSRSYPFKDTGARTPDKRHPSHRQVPIIMITAYGDAETKRKAMENGAEVLLTKPIDFVMLRNEIDVRVEGAA
jgi:CheY-like chemotaxis protein